MTKSYDISDSERVPIIMNRLGCEGLHFVQTLMDDEQETCKSSTGLLNILSANMS